MTTDEVIDLLTMLAAFDRRTLGEGDVSAWMLAVGDLPYDDAQLAVVKHYRESREWLMPSDIRHLVKQIRGERLAAVPLPAPTADLVDDPEAYAKALKEITARVANGRMPFRAIEGGRLGTEPPPAYKAVRPSEDNDRVLAQTITCPVEWCPARVGEPCRPGPDMPPMKRWHPSRLGAAREAS